MARYRRRSNHWMWQPRGLNGRFTKSGGGMPQGDPEWFRRMPLWQKILVLLAMTVVLVIIYETGLLIPLGIIGLVIAFAGK